MNIVEETRNGARAPMSLKELAEKTGIEEKRVYRVLSSLHKGGQIIHVRDDDNMRRYSPVEKPR